MRAGSLPRGQTSGVFRDSKMTPGLLAQLTTVIAPATITSGRRYLIQRRMLKLPLDPNLQELKRIVLILRVEHRISSADVHIRLAVRPANFCLLLEAMGSPTKVVFFVAIQQCDEAVEFTRELRADGGRDRQQLVVVV